MATPKDYLKKKEDDYLSFNVELEKYGFTTITEGLKTLTEALALCKLNIRNGTSGFLYESKQSGEIYGAIGRVPNKEFSAWHEGFTVLAGF